MNNDKLEKFKEKYCLVCGSQRCTGESEWLEGCPDYRQYMENPDKPEIVTTILDHFDINFRVVYPENKNKYVLIDEISKWMVDYCKRNNVAIINNVTGKPLFEK